MVFNKFPGRIFLAIGITDMRKSINGLGQIVVSDFKLELFNSDFFVFCNRRRDIIKILFWDKNGFCIWKKRLEKERFHWPKSQSEVIHIGRNQLSWLLAGLDISKAHKKLTYKAL
ncbi:IS66 family insertion sequence element accessory protein TnpB [Candidatus Riflebacteria bacterium]